MSTNHFTTHTHSLADELNSCGRYILVDILRTSEDFTNNGVSSLKNDYSYRFFVPCLDGPWKLQDIDLSRSIIFEVMPPAFEGCPFRLKVRGEKRWSMAGGNWAFTSDSRFSRAYGAPLSIHDRHE